MKALNLFFIIISFSLKGFAQDEEINQPDSIYRVNLVKERITWFENGGNKNKTITQYDRKGRHIESIYFNHSGNKYGKPFFQYDSTDKLTSEYYVGYFTIDSATDRMIMREDKPDTTVTNIFYDSLDRIAKKISSFPDGKINYLNTYTYNPLTIRKQCWNMTDTAPVSDITTVYELPNVSKRVFGYSMYKDFKSKQYIRFNTDYTYKNKFDKSGRLIKRFWGTTDIASNTINKDLQTFETSYIYNKAGLLIRKTSVTNYKNGKATLLFDYKYW